MEQPVKPDAVEPRPAPQEGESPVSQPTKLIRIASMTRAMLEEVRQAPLDESGRKRLAAVHERSLNELREVLSEELLDEFNEIMVPLDEAVTEAEITDRTGPADRLAGRPVPRDPGLVVVTTDGGSDPIGGDAETGDAPSRGDTTGRRPLRSLSLVQVPASVQVPSTASTSAADYPTLRSRTARSRRTRRRSRSLRPPQMPNFSPISTA